MSGQAKTARDVRLAFALSARQQVKLALTCMLPADRTHATETRLWHSQARVARSHGIYASTTVDVDIVRIMIRRTGGRVLAENGVIQG